MTASRLRPFGTTIFSEMTALAQQHGAINLAQGFPDFDGPQEVIDAACDALRRGHNQYARSMGHPLLVEALATKVERFGGGRYDPMREVVVFGGATEGLAAAMLGLLEPGDEVIALEPFYDSYPAVVAMAGGTLKACPLRWPEFRLEPERLERLVTPRTRVILLNTPHNPTGRVLDASELAEVARIARERDLIVVADEVYEHLTYGNAAHVSVATLPGMRERTLTISSSGKSYSLTGWKIGWATGPAQLVAAAQAAHQYLTFSSATPLQVAVGKALERLGSDYYAALKAEYDDRRRLLVGVLNEAGFTASEPEGTYFVMASFERLSDEDDRAFARRLVETHGVAAIPPSVFYAGPSEDGRRLMRFAFCKRRETLERAAERLLKLPRRV